MNPQLIAEVLRLKLWLVADGHRLGRRNSSRFVGLVRRCGRRRRVSLLRRLVAG